MGPPFWNEQEHPEKRTWVPIQPRTVTSDDQVMARTQIPLVLGWAITPWKAQGMTLEKVIVKIGAKAAAPGVLFTCLSRVRHPDDLMLEDDFPSMSVIMKQKYTESFQKRLHWERLLRVRFARTCRQHMRDPACYSANKLWTPLTAGIASDMLSSMPPTKMSRLASSCEGSDGE